MSGQGVSDRVPKSQIRIISTKRTKVGSMVSITVRVIISEMETTTVTNIFNRGNYDNRNDRNRPYIPPQNREVTPRDGGDSMARVEDMFHKIMRRFDAKDEHINELRSDLEGIGKKFDTHAISIKHLELLMTKLYTTEHTATGHSS